VDLDLDVKLSFTLSKHNGEWLIDSITNSVK